MDHIQGDHSDEEEISQHSLTEEPTDGIEELDPKGNLVLAVGRRRILVSSRVLELSCPFFKKMLQSNTFMEGVDQPNAENPPTKQLREDHPDIFYLICRALHYLPVRPPDSVDEYRTLADLCNFYGCGWALSFHVRAWMEKWNLSTLNTDELQGLLWVAFVFHLRGQFQHVSLNLAETLTTSKWKVWEVHPMPARLKEDIRELCDRVKGMVQRQIENMIDAVGEDNERHIGKRDKICVQCFRSKPWATKKCGHCGSSEFDDYLCTKEVRLFLFKEWLQSEGYWPLRLLNERSCRSFLGDMSSAVSSSRTPCGYDESCPLTGAKERLIASLGATLNNCTGLKLEHYDPEDLLGWHEEPKA